MLLGEDNEEEKIRKACLQAFAILWDFYLVSKCGLFWTFSFIKKIRFTLHEFKL